MMEAAVGQYLNPPVKEAIFAIAYKNRIDISAIRDFCALEWVRATYPKHSELSEDEAEDEPTSDLLGYTLHSTDKAITLRLTTTQFSYHNFNTYLGWEENRAAFLDAWGHMSGYCESSNIDYASIRYINRINLGLMPESGLELGEYINILPSLPDDFPGEPGRFFIQVQTFDTPNNLEGKLWSTFIPPSEEDNSVFIMLDISIRSDPSLTSLDLPVFLNNSRDFKNKLFESCITDNTRALLK